jgi:hypothetical protein
MDIEEHIKQYNNNIEGYLPGWVQLEASLFSYITEWYRETNKKRQPYPTVMVYLKSQDEVIELFCKIMMEWQENLFLYSYRLTSRMKRKKYNSECMYILMNKAMLLDLSKVLIKNMECIAIASFSQIANCLFFTNISEDKNLYEFEIITCGASKWIVDYVKETCGSVEISETVDGDYRE